MNERIFESILRESQFNEIFDALSKAWSDAGRELEAYKNGEYRDWCQSYFKEKKREYLDGLGRSIGVSDFDEASAYARRAIEKHTNTKKLQSLMVAEENARFRFEKASERIDWSF